MICLLFDPKGDQSWVFIERTDVEAETPNTLATWCEKLTHLKKPWCWERLRAGEGDDRGWDGWMASPTQQTWFGWTPGVNDGQGGLACYSSWGHKESDTTEQLNWTEPSFFDPPSILSQNIAKGQTKNWTLKAQMTPLHLGNNFWAHHTVPARAGFRIISCHFPVICSS